MYAVLLYPQARPGSFDPALKEKRRLLPPIPALESDEVEAAHQAAQELAGERYVVAVVTDAEGAELAAYGADPVTRPVQLPSRGRSSPERLAAPPRPRVVPSAGSVDPAEINRWIRASGFGSAGQTVYGVLTGGERLRIVTTKTVRGQLFARAQSTGRWVPITHAVRE